MANLRISLWQKKQGSQRLNRAAEQRAVVRDDSSAGFTLNKLLLIIFGHKSSQDRAQQISEVTLAASGARFFSPFIEL